MKTRGRIFSSYTLFKMFAAALTLAGCSGGGNGGGTDTSGGNNTNGGGTDSTATLTWTVPSTNADTTPLTDLAGYKIYMGNTISSNYNLGTTTVAVGDAGLSCLVNGLGDTECTYVINNLSTGIYYFTISAYDTSGNESTYSNEVYKAL